MLFYKVYYCGMVVTDYIITIHVNSLIGMLAYMTESYGWHFFIKETLSCNDCIISIAVLPVYMVSGHTSLPGSGDRQTLPHVCHDRIQQHTHLLNVNIMFYCFYKNAAHRLASFSWSCVVTRGPSRCSYVQYCCHYSIICNLTK